MLEVARDLRGEAAARPSVKAVMASTAEDEQVWSIILEMFEIVLHRRSYVVVKSQNPANDAAFWDSRSSEQVPTLASDLRREAADRPYVKTVMASVVEDENIWSIILEMVELSLHRRGYVVAKSQDPADDPAFRRLSQLDSEEDDNLRGE